MGRWWHPIRGDDGRVRLRATAARAAVPLIAIGLCVAIVGCVVPHLIEPATLRHAHGNMLIPLILTCALAGLGWAQQREAGSNYAAAHDRAQRLVVRDTLTGLYNRRGLTENGTTLLGRSRRRSKPIAVLILSVDQFKAINDAHGHAVGDALICEIAREWNGAMPPAAMPARIGGGEFACAFAFDAHDPGTVEDIAQRLAARFAQPFVCENAVLHVSAAIGIARSDFGSGSLEALLRAAAIAVAAARRAGRNRHSWFDLSMERDIQARAEIEDGLRHAIPRQQIVPHFEPQIDLPTGRIAGFEVLARWEHPQRGLIAPDAFIGIAEDSGLIGEISLAIMRQAFVAARDWHPALTLSVNISPHQLKDPWLAQKIIKTLTETSFPARRLEVEVTESALFDNLALAQSIIGSLKNQGIRVALDDFGTGYSSLAHLRALPFDRIKIDKSFILSLDDPDSLAIVKAIVSLGDSLNLPITAEGIETEAVQDRLCALGCAKGQGYLYGRPVGVANVRRLLAERRLLAAQLDPPVRAVPPAPAIDLTSQRLAG